MTRSRCATTGKVRYDNRDVAQTVQAKLPYNVDPYRCPDCEGWHLGGHHRKHKGDTLAQFGRPS